MALDLAEKSRAKDLRMKINTRELDPVDTVVLMGLMMCAGRDLSLNNLQDCHLLCHSHEILQALDVILRTGNQLRVIIMRQRTRSMSVSMRSDSQLLLQLEMREKDFCNKAQAFMMAQGIEVSMNLNPTIHIPHPPSFPINYNNNTKCRKKKNSHPSVSTHLSPLIPFPREKQVFNISHSKAEIEI